MMKSRNPFWLIWLVAYGLGPQLADAAIVSDVANTKHNLSASSTGEVKAGVESQICVFCHTPHGANSAAPGPLWNRQLSTTATYTTYGSDSTDAIINQPGGSSKLCLSCHDGAMTLGKVNVLNGAQDVTIATGTVTTMPAGSGTSTGFTRNLGTDLTNDHPISFNYDTNLITADTELYNPLTVTHIAERDPGVTPLVPLENGQVQCTTCHDPHIKDDTGADIKFLRLNRTQKTGSPSDGTYTSSSDIVCLACHNKQGWGNSAHARTDVANELYTTSAATQRGFRSDNTFQVWEAACLNCHDTHTVQGARRLLREGTDGALVTDATTGEQIRSGGSPAQEETCYQCHDTQANTILQAASNTVPDIKSDFAATFHMPITSTEQAAGTEVHSIGTGVDATEGTQRGQDFVESPDLLGKASLTNRHAECTDCHNPHRVIKNRAFNGTPSSPDAAGTHKHNLAAGEIHSNIASGVLAGTTGVEPVYGSPSWGSAASSYLLKRGYAAPGASTGVDAGTPHVTREYQVCLKCHSDYAWNSPPTVGPSIGTNGLTQYTDQAMEFQAPSGDKGEPAVNHRSWHPVIDATGRDVSVRSSANGAMSDTNFLAPWNNTTGTAVGSQTMYCTDCHGSETAMGTSEPNGGENGSPWGPHGSGKDFILKGNWDADATTATTSAGDSSSANPVSLCFRCHSYDAYSNAANATAALSANYKSGFSSGTSTAMGCTIDATVSANNLHLGHRTRIGKDLRCTWCHVAVPHGWKNKALLVDINDATTANPPGCAGVEPCNKPPYYVNAMLGGGGAVNWKTSGNWTHTDCGGANGFASWMGGTCNNPP